MILKKFYKKAFIICFFVFCLMGLSLKWNQSHAEEQLGSSQQSEDLTEESSTNLAKKDIEIEINIGTQSPITKSVPVTVSVTSEFDSKETFIRWNISRQLTLSQDKEKKFSLFKGQTYEFIQNVNAKTSGEHKIIVEIEAWRADGNYIATQSITLDFNNKLELTPQPEEYQRAVIVWMVIRILLIVFGVLLLIFIIKLGYSSFKKWLEKD